MTQYIFDSFALLCFFHEEPGMGKVEELLIKAEQDKVRIFLSTVNLAEIYYTIIREYDEIKAQEAIAIIYNLPIEIVDVDAQLALEAGKIKAANPIALGDCFAAALAKLKDATIVTGDPEFKTVENKIPVVWLLI